MNIGIFFITSRPQRYKDKGESSYDLSDQPNLLQTTLARKNRYTHAKTDASAHKTDPLARIHPWIIAKKGCSPKSILMDSVKRDFLKSMIPRSSLRLKRFGSRKQERRRPLAIPR